MRRLGLSTLGSVPESARPLLDPRQLTPGVLHLGVGNFHRAHQAVYTEDAMVAAGETRWAISAVTQRGPRVRDQLQPQDGLYALTLRDGAEEHRRVVSAIREVLDGPSETEAVLQRLADPATTVVTVTVTEKAYRLHPVTQLLDLDDPETRADAAGRSPATVVGRLVAGLRRRRRTGAGPLAVISCDNLSENGAVLRGAVLSYCSLLADGDDLAAWIVEHVTFPASMVDRIVPAMTERDRTRVATALGVRDEASVVAEPLAQWVIEDDFRAPRPAWEQAGALLVSDVRPYELAKLRTLNASHSLLAYLGGLVGIATIAEAVEVGDLAQAARRLAEREVRPTLPTVDGLDHGAYVESVLRRFANPTLAHTTGQVASDGSRKIGPRLLGTIADCLSLGTDPAMATLTVAAWLRHVLVQRTDDGRPVEVDDPAAAAMLTATRGRTGVGAVRPALAAAGVQAQLLDVDRFTSRVEQWYAELERAGVRATLRRAVG